MSKLKWKDKKDFNDCMNLIMPFGRYEGIKIKDIVSEEPYYFLGLSKNTELRGQLKRAVMYAACEAEELWWRNIHNKAYQGLVDNSPKD
jgi:uncharacterized protein (DUF3820 family)